MFKTSFVFVFTLITFMLFVEAKASNRQAIAEKVNSLYCEADLGAGLRQLDDGHLQQNLAFRSGETQDIVAYPALGMNLLRRSTIVSLFLSAGSFGLFKFYEFSKAYEKFEFTAVVDQGSPLIVTSFAFAVAGVFFELTRRVFKKELNSLAEEKVTVDYFALDENSQERRMLNMLILLLYLDSEIAQKIRSTKKMPARMISYRFQDWDAFEESLVEKRNKPIEKLEGEFLDFYNKGISGFSLGLAKFD